MKIFENQAIFISLITSKIHIWHLQKHFLLLLLETNKTLSPKVSRGVTDDFLLKIVVADYNGLENAVILCRLSNDDLILRRILILIFGGGWCLGIGRRVVIPLSRIRVEEDDIPWNLNRGPALAAAGVTHVPATNLTERKIC